MYLKEIRHNPGLGMLPNVMCAWQATARGPNRSLAEEHPQPDSDGFAAVCSMAMP
jgi:hypothetical protein